MVNLCGELFRASLPRPKHGVVAPNLGDDSGRHEDHGTTEFYCIGLDFGATYSCVIAYVLYQF